MLMELIIILFITPMGATISGHWDLGDTGTLVRSLGWQCECLALCLWHGERERCGQILQPSLYLYLPIWLRPLTAKRANNQAKHVYNSTTPQVCGIVVVVNKYCEYDVWF